MSRTGRLVAIVGLAGRQLRHFRRRTLLTLTGVAVAVALMVLLTGLGNGVVTAGSSGLDWLGQDLWVSAGSLWFAPETVGGVENSMLDAHQVTARIDAMDGVESADALAFQTVYASTNRSSFSTVVGVGVTGNGERLSTIGDGGFTSEEVHYANGSYDGPMSGEIVVDERTAEMFDVGVGDTLYVGGTVASARANAFEVVGIASTFSTYLGVPTVTLHLGELQTLTGTTGTDPASLVTVSVAPGADTAAVQREIEREFPGYEVRTNREQLGAVAGNQATIVGSVVTLVVLAIVVGATLVANVLALLVYHQRRQLAALKAMGMRDDTLVGLVTAQALGIGALGGPAGCALAVLITPWLNAVIADLSGFPALIKTPWWVIAGGIGLAFAMALVGAAVAGWRVLRLRPLEQLRG